MSEPRIDLPPLSRLRDAALLEKGTDRARAELSFMGDVRNALLEPMTAAYGARDWALLSRTMAAAEEALVAAYAAEPAVLARALTTLCGDIVTAGGLRA